MSLFALDTPIDAEICGAKAARLSLLKRNGFNVPEGWAISADTSDLDTVANALLPDRARPLIVRSSAIGEDGDTSSAAGQYLSIGPVETREAFIAAVQTCRESYHSESAIAYRQQRGLPDADMAVLVQPYQRSRVAGVAFSRHPLDGAPFTVIEALPEAAAVVGGQHTPEHLEIQRADAPEEAWQSEHLPNDALRSLVEQVTQIEALFHGIPQDVEWLWDGDRLWIVQTRPISTLNPIWTRTIAAEVIPGAIHPLTWSINQPLTCGVWGDIYTVVLAERASGLDFSETATLFGSHAYFNATLLGEIFRLMGLPEQSLEFLLRGESMGKPPIASMVRNVPGIVRLLNRERVLPDEFERDCREIFDPALQQLETQALADLSASELLERAANIQVWLEPITYYNIVSPIGLAIRLALFRVSDELLPNNSSPEILSSQDLRALASDLHAVAQGDFDRDRLDTLLIEHPDFSKRFEQWLDTYGYLSEVGTDIAVPTWSDRPETVKTLLFSLARQTQTDATETNTGWGKRWRAKQCEGRARVRDRVAEIYARLLAHLRWTFVALENLGRVTGVFASEGDIFFLKYDEVKRWVANELTPAAIAPLIAERRTQLETDRDRSVPPVIYGDRMPQPRAVLDAEAANDLQGIPASVGLVEGTVQICRSLASYTPAPSDTPVILVVPYTDAGWAPLLASAQAIVSEVGGQLSHGAIVAREYGIPAVMNVERATQKLQEGQWVRVDGERGIVEILTSEPHR